MNVWFSEESYQLHVESGYKNTMHLNIQDSLEYSASKKVCGCNCLMIVLLVRSARVYMTRFPNSSVSLHLFSILNDGVFVAYIITMLVFFRFVNFFFLQLYF